MRKIYLLLSVMLLFSVMLKAQNRTVTGTVTDEKAEPIPGASIQVKGGILGAVTDVNGKYSIRVTDLQNVVIGVKFLGYNYQEKTLKPGENSVSFQLVPAENSLNEVVVVGYGTQKRVDLTAAVTTYDLKNAADIPSTSLSVALKGLSVGGGVGISGGESRPGQPATITIRNPVFFSSNGQSGGPLYVIDDAYRTASDFNLLDVTEIENITILKDAAAAVYGIQGANGVIVVRTKRGKNGPPKISFSTSMGNARAIELPKMMSGLQLATYLNDDSQVAESLANPATYVDPNGYIGGVVTNKLSTYYTPDELAYFAANNNNYVEQAFHTSDVERATLNISGGSDKATYFVGANYVNQNSNFSGVNTYKYGLRASVDANLAKGLKVAISLSDDYSYSRSYWYKLQSTTESLDNDFLSLTQVPPWSQYFINGQPNLFTTSTSAAAVDNVNFFAIQQSNNYTESLNYIINATANVTYQIPGVKGLSAYFNYNDNINFGFPTQYGTQFNYVTYSGTGQNNHIPGGTFVNSKTLTNGSRVRIVPTFTTAYQLDAGLNYTHTWGKHTITLISLYEQTETNSDGVAAEADGPIVGGLDNQNFTTGAQSSNQSTLVSEAGTEAFVNRLNYNYADKYLAEVIFRADASTVLSPSHQWGYFPGGSVGWVASKEHFIADNYKFIDLLKFRFSAGLVGSNNIPAYKYATNYAIGTGGSGGAVFGSPSGERGLGISPNVALANPDISWDSNFKTNYGIDMAFLNNRLSLTGEYYFNHGYNMLTTLSSSVSALVAATTPPENYSSANTFGYELTATWSDKIGKDFSYLIRGSFGWSDNKLLKYDLASGLRGTVQDRTGKSSDGGVFGLVYEGMFRTQQDVNNYLAVHPGYTIFGQTPEPGMLYYKDLNGDGKITTDASDETYISNKSSNHNGAGLTLGGSYKEISFNLVAGVSWGGTGSVEGQAQKLATSTENRPEFWADHWTPTNTNAAFPAPYYNADYSTFASSFWFRSSTTVNISRINVGYTVPTKYSTILGVNSIRAFFVATNPLNLYNPYTYRDNSASYSVYPTLKTFSIGLNVAL